MTRTHILLADAVGDDRQTVRGLDEAGFQVTTVDSATAALASLSRGEFDCLVSAHDLPGDDGLSLFEAVRALDEKVPFILYADDDSLAEEAFSLGVDRFVHRDTDQSVPRLVDELTEVTTSARDLPPQRDISGHEPGPTEVVRAIDKAPVGISICDPSLPDYPLVYVNDTWQEVTGYSREEALGRNPRLLQGPETDDEATEAISEAIDSGKSVTTEIRNYRRDGTPFWNELTLSPVRDESSELSLYVGFQNDVTGRRNTREVATERAAKLTDEKRALHRILSRINGLLNNITHILVEEKQPQLIAQQICDEIASERGYTGSWFGSPGATGDELEIEAQAGLNENVDSPLSRQSLPDIVDDAVESGELTLCQAGTCDAEYLSPGTVDARRLLVVPVVDSKQTYGVLAIYSESIEALDRREQQLFNSIGTMIASRLNAIRTAQILTADTVIELKMAIHDNAFPVSAVAGTLGADVEYVGMTSDSDAGTYELFLSVHDSVDLGAVVKLAFVHDVREISATDSSLTFAVTVGSGEPFIELADHGASVTQVTAGPERATVVLELPPEQDVRTILGVLEDRYADVELRSRYERDTKGQTVNEFASAVDERLTARQRAAVEAAYMNGYFEWPRPTDGAEVADTLGITRQTFHQHLRVAEQKLVDAYIERYVTAGGDTALAEEQ
ncbi:bacterio-opsin activator domain-containing protein [Halovenus salina]|uniref:Bacterio-opsin activator domain-containing protein n=1 Tax=Halovenus salina TaxID=1510225 RepID=A0ABD5W1N0_9EURY|nr:bacterio-opsin activator domain-containing protein [Halovenus salina]